MNKIINSSGFKFSWKNYTTKPDKRSDDYFDMRKWQKHAFDVLHSNKYMILNAPTGSGKSWLICLLSDFKLRKNNNLRCIITVPQTIIANGFAEANLITPDEEKIPWFAQHNLCNDVEQDGNINYVIKWLEGPYGFFFDKILICTHATLVGVYKQLKKTKRLKLLNDLLLWVDEAHHIKNTSIEGFENTIVSNGIGEIVSFIINKTNSQVGLATASFFRGDRISLLTSEMQGKFARFNLSYDEYLKDMEHLCSFSFDFILCGKSSYQDAIGELLRIRKGKDIIHIPSVNSRHSTGDKYQEVENIKRQYKSAYGGKTIETSDGLTLITNKDSELKLIDLVNEELRSEKKEYINNIKEKDDLDAVIALGMFKEGANWIWADRSMIVGIRESLVEIMQIIGRLFRDAVGKTHVEVIQLLPFALDQTHDDFKDNLNNYMKAIFASLILENILHPVQIKFKEENKSEKSGGERPNWLSELLQNEVKQQSLIEDVRDSLLQIANNSTDTIFLWNEYQKILPKILSEYGITEKIDEIGKQIWAMMARKTLQMEGIDVEDIDFDIIQQTSPLGFLLRYTSHCGVDTLEKLRKIINKSSIENKRQLLEMAKLGEPRPNRIHLLNQVLFNYTNENNGCYDAEFDKQIRELRPDWFINTANENKKQLLEIAKQGKPRPEKRKHILGNNLISYTNENNGCYDAEFDKQIRELRPDWFVDTVVENKNQLLDMAKNGEPRPNGKLKNNLRSYTTKSQGCYDAEFDKQIRELRPDWFVDTVVENKNQLLDMAKNGEPRPVYSKHTLGTALFRYTSKLQCCYDAEFDKQIRELRPDWFVDTVVENKKQLLDMAKNGEPRPNSMNTHIGGCLCRYISKKKSYDAEFDKQIRELRPDWFVDTVVENKKQLLDMAKRGEPRPIRNNISYNNLAESFVRYTKKNGQCYDAKFDKQMRELRPDWYINFIDRAKQKKNQLLEMAKNGNPRPSVHTHIGGCLCRYVSKKENSYDAEFDKQIRELRPDWFVDTAAENKKQLLDMAKCGEPRPKGILNRYTSKSNKCYDAEFDKQIRELRPDWFVDTVVENKKQLLEMAKRGEPRPSNKLVNNLRSYTNKSQGCYDAEFDKLIRELAPHWFKK